LRSLDRPMTPERLQAVATDVMNVSWSPDGGMTGEVIWSNERQAGFIVIDGLDVNDPSDFQYQLWIFDDALAAYSENTAIDGGVFDVTADGRVVIPISAKLEVKDPTLFAITSEPPGGVVKHNPERDPERYRIVAVAPIA
ncbi:MAG: anti-sigma factor, partial [Planctomycetota bacterium]